MVVEIVNHAPQHNSGGLLVQLPSVQQLDDNRIDGNKLYDKNVGKNSLSITMLKSCTINDT